MSYLLEPIHTERDVLTYDNVYPFSIAVGCLMNLSTGAIRQQETPQEAIDLTNTFLRVRNEHSVSQRAVEDFARGVRDVVMLSMVCSM